MAREDLVEEITTRMNKGGFDAPETEEPICQNCGTSPTDPYIDKVPEHGTDIVYEVVYCDEQCKDVHIDELIERVE